MILHYLFKKENKEQELAHQQYRDILKTSKLLIDKNLFKKKDYNISFEIISNLLIIYMRVNIKLNNKEIYKKINDHLVEIFISDLDDSLRIVGIGDMSIGKYVKSYVKKFYYRIKKFPLNLDIDSSKILENYLNNFNFIRTDKTPIVAKNFIDIYNSNIKNG